MIVSSDVCAHVQETLHLPRGHIVGRAVVALLQGAWHTPPVSGIRHPLPPETSTIGLASPQGRET